MAWLTQLKKMYKCKQCSQNVAQMPTKGLVKWTYAHFKREKKTLYLGTLVFSTEKKAVTGARQVFVLFSLELHLPLCLCSFVSTRLSSILPLF